MIEPYSPNIPKVNAEKPTRKRFFLDKKKYKVKKSNLVSGKTKFYWQRRRKLIAEARKSIEQNSILINLIEQRAQGGFQGNSIIDDSITALAKALIDHKSKDKSS